MNASNVQPLEVDWIAAGRMHVVVMQCIHDCQAVKKRAVEDE